MTNLIVAGIGTEVGKTVVAAILTVLFDGDYWKPIQSGYKDTDVIQNLINPACFRIHPATYSLKAPFSPHHAALLENVSIDLDAIQVPVTDRPLIIESVGGVLVPLNNKELTIDLFKNMGSWIVVSRHYLGSINHTLLTIEALRHRQQQIQGIIFNGTPNPDTESVILEMTKLKFLGRLLPEKQICSQTIKRYAEEWRPIFSQLKL
jgi:dethiobiotin synthetase